MVAPTRQWLALALAAALATVAAACSSGPQSGVTASLGAPTASPSAAAETTPPTAPPSAPPSEATATDPPPPSATPGIPSKPAKVSFKETDRETVSGDKRVTYRLAWSAPPGVATTFTVVGVTKCLRNAKRYDGKACVVTGMSIPKAAQEVIATVPGDLRTVDVTWKEGKKGRGPYGAVLIRASNAAGDSIFTIAWSATVCYRCGS